MNSSRIIRIKDVVARVALSRSTIYRKMDSGTFPRSIELTESAIGWHEHEIDEWLRTRKPANQNNPIGV